MPEELMARVEDTNIRLTWFFDEESTCLQASKILRPWLFVHTGYIHLQQKLVARGAFGKVKRRIAKPCPLFEWSRTYLRATMPLSSNKSLQFKPFLTSICWPISVPRICSSVWDLRSPLKSVSSPRALEARPRTAPRDPASPARRSRGAQRGASRALCETSPGPHGIKSRTRLRGKGRLKSEWEILYAVFDAGVSKGCTIHYSKLTWPWLQGKAVLLLQMFCRSLACS